MWSKITNLPLKFSPDVYLPRASELRNLLWTSDKTTSNHPLPRISDLLMENFIFYVQICLPFFCIPIGTLPNQNKSLLRKKLKFLWSSDMANSNHPCPQNWDFSRRDLGRLRLKPERLPFRFPIGTSVCENAFPNKSWKLTK